MRRERHEVERSQMVRRQRKSLAFAFAIATYHAAVHVVAGNRLVLDVHLLRFFCKVLIYQWQV